MIDVPPTLAAALPAAIAEVTAAPVTHVIYTHSHGDHIGVAGVLFPDATFVSHRETAATLERRGDARRPVPRRTFRDRVRLPFGSQGMELVYPGPNHEPGNIMVWVPGAATLMWVDVVFPGWVPFKDLALAQDVPGTLAGHDTALSIPFETFVGGHLTRLGTRTDVEVARTFLRDVRAAAGAALGSVDFSAIAGETGVFDPSSPTVGNQWLLFDRYLDEVAHVAEAQVLSTWLHQLGGADVFTFGHCFAMAESIRIDDNAVADAL